MTEQKNDKELEFQLVRNERIFEHPTFGRVRLRRPTPSQESFIAEERRNQYHRDLKNPDILSKTELEQIYIKRGMWSASEASRMADLSKKVGDIMAALDGVGFRSLDPLLDEFHDAVTELRDHFAEDEEALAAVNRYFDLDKTPTASDRFLMRDRAKSSAMDDVIQRAEGTRAQIDLLYELAKARNELNVLQQKHTRLFVDSIESRMDRKEEFARLYCCATHADTGTALWPTFDEMLDAPAEVIETLMNEMFYFMYGITDEFKEVLSRHGFIQRATDTDDSSEGSPGRPQSNSDGESLDSEPTSSSEPTESSPAS